MSLINQMLRDLDARRAPAADRTQLQDMVHAAQKRPGRFGPVPILSIAVLAAGAAGVWYWLSSRGQPVPPMPAVAASQAAPAAAPPVAAARRDAPPPAAAPAAPAAVARAEPSRPDGARKDKHRKGDAGASAPRQAAAVPAGAATPVSSKATLAAAEPSIEKRPHTPLASEAAENEYNKAIAALRRGATAEAIAGLQSALRLDMLHVPARQALLSLLLRQQQWGDAQTVAEEGLAVDPSQTDWAITLARLQMENGKLAEASETLARHARHADRDADYQAFHALLLQKQKRYHEACDRYIAAVTLRPGEARWWYGLGVSLEADERPQEAHEAFLKAKEVGNLPPELAGSLKFHLH